MTPNKPDAVNPAMALRLAIEDLLRRVTDPERWAKTMIRKVTIIGPLCGLLLGAVVTWVLPRVYQSEIMIAVSDPNFVPNASTSTCAAFDAADFENLTSPTSLRKVAANLDLASRWHVDGEKAVRMLLGMVTWRHTTETRQISIDVRHTDRVEARNIAEKVARAYQQLRLERVERQHQQFVREIHQAIKDQERIVDDRRSDFMAIKRVIDRNHGPNGTSFLLHLKYSSDDYSYARGALEFQKDRLQMLELTRDTETIRYASEKAEVQEVPNILDSSEPPNVSLNLAIGALSGLLISPLMVWRGKRRGRRGWLISALIEHPTIRQFPTRRWMRRREAP